MTEDAKKPLGRILVRQQAITQPELDRALLAEHASALLDTRNAMKEFKRLNVVPL